MLLRSALVFVLSVVTVWAAPQEGQKFKMTLKMWQQEQEVPVLIHEIKQGEKLFLVNEICARNPKACLALKSLEKSLPSKSSPRQDATGLTGHPASLLCEALGGVDVILSDERKEQYNYCSFKDQTLIDSWQVHAVFAKKEQKK